MRKRNPRRHYVAFVLSAIAPLLLLDITQALAGKKNPSAAPTSKAVYAALADAPEKSQSKHNPFEHDPNAVAAGTKLFQQYCAECHGHIADGGKRGPSLHAPEVQQATPGSLFWILSNGVVRRGMPDWSKLPEPERWQIVTFMKSLGPSRKPTREQYVIPQERSRLRASSKKGGPLR